MTLRSIAWSANGTGALAAAIVLGLPNRVWGDGPLDRLIALTEPVIANHLRDPQSALFSGVYVVTTPIPIYKTKDSPAPASVCGWVNSKNGYGGYAGRVRFFAVYSRRNGALDDTQLLFKIEESAEADGGGLGGFLSSAIFEGDWRRRCLDAGHPLGSPPDDSTPPTAALAPPVAPVGAATASAGSEPLKFGVGFVDLTPQLAALFGRPDLSGALVTAVEHGSVAETSGVKIGDVVTNFGGAAVHTKQDLQAAVAASQSGANVTLTVARGSGNIELHAQF